MTRHSPIVDTSESANSPLKGVSVTSVRIADGFWSPRQTTNRTQSIPGMLELLQTTGRLENFRWAAGESEAGHTGREFNDSDVYKWLEAAAWSLAAHPDPALEAEVSAVIETIAAAQRPDGYLDTLYAREKADLRWTDHDMHEMYCAGHLFQAAVAHHRATGSEALLAIARRVADHIDGVFGPAEQGKRWGTDGHPEVEMGLVELGRETGEQRYVTLAQFLVDARGDGKLGRPYDRWESNYHQDHIPFCQMPEVTGHAVRMVYLGAGATDLVAERGEAAMATAVDRLWRDMTARKQYVSGAIGSRYDGEAFGEAYELPNRLAYGETCAAIGGLMWSWRMHLLTGDPRFVDDMELRLFNAILAGVALDGLTFFYQNPLQDEGEHRRAPWFDVACCPPNVARLLAQLGGYLYSVDGDGVNVEFAVANSADVALADGRHVALTVETGYPWQGGMRITTGTAGDYALRVRIPGWCVGATIAVNGGTPQPAAAGRYAEVRRAWAAGDALEVTLPLAVRLVDNHPYVTENLGRVATFRGPVLYCLEQTDHPGADIRDLRAPDPAALAAEHRADLLGGVTVLTGPAPVASPAAAWSDALYAPAGSLASSAPSTATLTAVPYYAWANRAPGRMRVWLPRA
jgi:DUF1680 family protein